MGTPIRLVRTVDDVRPGRYQIEMSLTRSGRFKDDLFSTNSFLYY